MIIDKAPNDKGNDANKLLANSIFCKAHNRPIFGGNCTILFLSKFNSLKLVSKTILSGKHVRWLLAKDKRFKVASFSGTSSVRFGKSIPTSFKANIGIPTSSKNGNNVGNVGEYGLI